MMDPGAWRLLLLLVGIALGGVLVTFILSLGQRGRKNAFWKYLPTLLFGLGAVWSIVRMAGASEGFADLAWFLTALMARAGALPSLRAAWLLGRRHRKRSDGGSGAAPAT
jgi:hypothetical protein